MQCCESPAEERGAGNLHATFCGNRGRVTASGDPVGGERSVAVWPKLPRLSSTPPFRAALIPIANLLAEPDWMAALTRGTAVRLV